MAKKVLIVDDIAHVRNTLRDILTQAHYEVVGECSDGLQALAAYPKLAPDLVTMDIAMPKMSGIEVTKRLLQQHKQAKVIIISALNQENLAMEAIHAGAKDYIFKPFYVDEVLKTLEKVLLQIG